MASHFYQVGSARDDGGSLADGCLLPAFKGDLGSFDGLVCLLNVNLTDSANFFSGIARIDRRNLGFGLRRFSVDQRPVSFSQPLLNRLEGGVGSLPMLNDRVVCVCCRIDAGD